MPALGHDDQDEDQSPDNLDPNDDTDASAQATVEDDANVPRVVEEDERLATSDEGEGDEHDEVDPSAGRRRETAKERRERAKRAKEADKQTIEILQRTVAKQNETVEKLRQEFTAKRVTELDERIATAVQDYENMDRVFGAAITAKNGEDARKAERLREEARQKAWNLDAEKKQLLTEASRPAPAAVPYQNKAVAFLQDKPWYNPKAGDEDSLVVEALDRALSKTMDPNSDDYWKTLDQKVKARLPHRFAQSNQDDASDDDGQDQVPAQRTQRRGPPTGGTSRASGSGNTRPNEIRLPREMVDAMKEAGHWDDPKQRARVAKRYVDGLKNRSNG